MVSTELLCPARVLKCSPLRVSHRRIIKSSLPQASVNPSGDNATETTQPMFPTIVRLCFPVRASHRCIVLSLRRVTSVDAPGE